MSSERPLFLELGRQRTSVNELLAGSYSADLPRRLIGDRAYDADPLDEALVELGIEMIAPTSTRPQTPRDPGWSSIVSVPAPM